MNLFITSFIILFFCIFSDTGKSIINSSLKGSEFEVPNPPYKVSIDSPDETGALEIKIDSETGWQF